MLRSASKILLRGHPAPRAGYRLSATDGEIGRCVDFLLEQPTWIIRYVLVDPGARLEGRRVLVSPFRLRKTEWASRRWVVDGTREQVEAEPENAPSLQSLKQLIGFGLDDSTGNLGHIEDLIVDDDSWHCRYLVINGEMRLPARRTLVPTEWLGRVHLEEHRVEATVARPRIESQPEYHPEAPVYRARALSEARSGQGAVPGSGGAAASPAAERDVPPSWRFNPPLAWAAAVQWGTRALGAALARNSHGR